MFVCNIENYNKICNYLKAGNSKPCPSSEKPIAVPDAFGSSIISLAKKQKQKQLLGTSAEEEAQVRQWLEYAVCTVNYLDTPLISQLVLKDLNTVFAQQTYIVGYALTLADVVMYHLLYKTMSNLSFQEKEQYMHLSRWYNNVQQDGGVRGSNALITFSRTPLY